MALEKFKAAPLPNPPAQYDSQYIRQMIRVLEIYFNQLDSLTPNQAQSYRADNFYGGDFSGDSVTADSVNADTLTARLGTIGTLNSSSIYSSAGNIQALRVRRIISRDMMADNYYGNFFYGDGRYLNTPYNQFESSQDQTGAVATATAVTFNVDVFPDSISIASNSQITFAIKGVYLLTYSLSFKNTTNDRQDIDVWFRYKGNDIANSNSKFSIPARKSTGDPAYLIAVTPYTIDIVADGDYVQIMWRVTDAAVVLEQLPAVTASPGVTPAIPATPSAILTVQFVSSQYPPVKRIAPLPVFGFGQVGVVEVLTNRG